MTMLRAHFMQQWFTLSDPPAMEEAFFDTPLSRAFAQLEEFARMPDESTILRFRHRLEEHKLAEQILVTINELLTAKGLLLKAGTVVASGEPHRNSCWVIIGFSITSRRPPETPWHQKSKMVVRGRIGQAPGADIRQSPRRLLHNLRGPVPMPLLTQRQVQSSTAGKKKS